MTDFKFGYVVTSEQDGLTCLVMRCTKQFIEVTTVHGDVERFRPRDVSFRLCTTDEATQYWANRLAFAQEDFDAAEDELHTAQEAFDSAKDTLHAAKEGFFYLGKQ